jgi:hypothetical protein
MGARGSVVGWGSMLQAGRSQVRDPMKGMIFINLPNEYQKQKNNNVSGE